MPFEMLETVHKGNQQPQASLSYMRAVRKGKEFDRGRIKPKLIITVPTVKFTSKAERFALLIGTGADVNKLRLRAAKDKKAIKPTQFKSFLVFRFGYVPALGEEIFDGIKCDIERISDDEYEIVVPLELKLSEAAAETMRKLKSA